MLTQSSRDRNILKNLAWFEAFVHLSNGQGKMDINHDAEDFYCGLLNILFTNNSVHSFADKEVQLHNMNSIQMDYPAIDLGDERNRLCVQITSSEHREKVRTTLKKFFAHNLDATYDRLIVLMIGTKDEFTKKFDVERNFDFDANRDVWDTNRLGAEIGKLSDERRQILASYIDDRVETQKEKTVHLHLPLPKALDPSKFVGRKRELEAIRSCFDQGDKQVVLTGLGGIGKTELAIHFGHGYRANCKGLVFFTTFTGSFRETLISMYNSLRDKPEIKKPSPDEMFEAVQNALSKCGSTDILIVDNVDADQGNLGDLLDDVYDLLEQMELRLILTTRFDWDDAIDVDILEKEELYQIFRKHSLKISQTDMDSLISAVNSHTLTVDLMARMFNGKGIRPVTPQMLLDAFANNTVREEKYRKIAAHYKQSPKQAHIYEHLSAVFNVANLSPEAENVLRCATLLPVSGMESVMFADSIPEEWEDALEELSEHGWLSAENGLLTIHPVIRLVCRTELKPTDENCGNFLNALGRQYDSKVYDQVKYAQLADVFALAAVYLEDQDAEWINASSYFRLHLAQYSSARVLYETHLPTLEERLNDTKQLSTVYNNLGSIYGELGDYMKSLEFKLKALEIRKKVLTPEHPSLAISYNNVGTSYDALGNHRMALEFKLKALKIQEKVLPPDHPSLAISYNNMGITYGDLGDHCKALVFKLKALKIQEKILSQEHPQLAIFYNNVGATYGTLGDHEKALEYKLKAMKIREKVLTPCHPDLAISYNDVGSSYGARGDHSRALEFKLKALEIRKKVLTPDHPSLAASYNNVGSTYDDLGDHNNALDYKLKAMRIFEKVLTPEHPHLAGSYNNVGTSYAFMEDFPKAIEYLKKALAIMEQVLPPGHSDTEMMRKNLAYVRSRMK